MLDGLREISGADVCSNNRLCRPEGNDIGLVYIGVMIGNEKAVTGTISTRPAEIRNRTTRNALAELWRNCGSKMDSR